MLKKSKVVMLPVNKKRVGCLCLGGSGQDAMLGLIHDPILILDGYYKGHHLYVLSDDKIKEGDWCLLDWEGQGITGDIRIGEALMLRGDRINMTNQYGNESHCDKAQFPNSKWWKIIATTDSLLIDSNLNDSDRVEDIEIYMPQIPTSFIKYFIAEYNKGNTVSEVRVEYKHGDEVCTCGVKREDHFCEKGGKIYSTYRHVYIDGGELKPKVCKDNTVSVKPIKDSWSRWEVEDLILTAYDEVCGRAGYWEQMNEWIKENL